MVQTKGLGYGFSWGFSYGFVVNVQIEYIAFIAPFALRGEKMGTEPKKSDFRASMAP
jgi:hypothetical protein